MSSLRIDLSDLSRMQRQWAALLPGGAFGSVDAGRLTQTAVFGENPGHLRMLHYVPSGLPPGAALVVVLHGCGQDAAGYDSATGWSVLAERHGFALLYPEQLLTNNSHGCFNWFEPGDAERGHHECHSIRQMVAAMLLAHQIDPAQVWVTGLSAGGAMAAALLATAPDMFAGGAIIAAPPFGAAANSREAMAVMAHCPLLSPAEWGDKVRAASPEAPRRPAVSIWQGDADTTVTPGNAIEAAKQWTNVHAIAEANGTEDLVDGVPHRSWRDRDGRVCVELYAVPGLAHGTPIDPAAAGDRGVGHPERFVLQAPIASTWRIARSWRLVPDDAPPKPAMAHAAGGLGRTLHKLARRLM